MMQITKKMNAALLRSALFTVTLALLGISSSQAAAPDGTWKFERAVDYDSGAAVKKAPKFPTLAFHDDEIQLSETCKARVSTKDYYFSDVFQAMTKDDIKESQVENFLQKTFNLSLSKTKSVYRLKSKPDYCASPLMEFFVINDRMLIPAGDIFYTYVKAQAEIPASASGASTSQTDVLAPGYKLSRLPVDFERYNTICRPKIMSAKGKPQTSDKCAPDFYPYVADSKSNDLIMKIVGNHDYTMGGHRYADGFSPPFKQKTAATFLVFPPMKQITLIRVDDFEAVRNEQRDVMSGVYLSIVDGKVVDQISGCHFNRDYICVDEDRVVAKLMENGKFQRTSSR